MNLNNDKCGDNRCSFFIIELENQLPSEIDFVEVDTWNGVGESFYGMLNILRKYEF